MREPYRVLDLTDDRAQLAAEILCSIGHDVVLIEPPGGSTSRLCALRVDGDSAPERSLAFWGWNRGKRSIVLDLDSPAGEAELLDLAGRADVVFESGAIPVDLARLREANPALVTVSISAFGTTGPKVGWPATDLTVLAAGGQLALTGDSDRPPVRTTEPQAFLHAAGDAACGALTALFERARSGLGQHVDVSAQRSVLFATQSHVLATPYRAALFHRMAGGHSIGGIDVQMLWPCRDGHVMVMLLFGPAFGPYTARLMSWLRDEGLCDDALAEVDWVAYGSRLFSGREPVEGYERIKDAVGALCMAHDKSELLQAAVERRLLIGPTATTAEIITSSQFADRAFWDDFIDDAVSASPIRTPGLPVRTSSKLQLGRAPRIDEHAADLPGGGWQPRPPADVAASAGDRAQPFEGVRVVDLTWALSGPATARFLADYGATVVHVESSHHIDAARTVQPFLADDASIENAAVYHNMNVGKISVSINLGCPEGRAVLDDLISWADVLIESFSPRARSALQLDYERLAADHPKLIMMSSSLFGQEGPLSGYAGFGNMAAAVVGFHELTGWPDRAPAGPFSAYTDYVSPRFAIPLLIDALDDCRRTGRGRYLDFAQAEAALHFLTPCLLDASVNGRVASRRGNDDVTMAPHGVYPCAGTDRWVAVACRDDRDWAALAGILGRDDLATMSADERRSSRRELDQVVGFWTATLAACEVQHVLIGAGVPAHAVQHSPECVADPQLEHLGHLVVVDHPHHGTVTVEASRVTLSATPSVLQRGAPVLGQHTIDTLTELLGYDEARLGALLGAGALE